MKGMADCEHVTTTVKVEDMTQAELEEALIGMTTQQARMRTVIDLTNEHDEEDEEDEEEHSDGARTPIALSAEIDYHLQALRAATRRVATENLLSPGMQRQQRLMQELLAKYEIALAKLYRADLLHKLS